MHGPAQHGVIIYSNDIGRLASFYATLFNMDVMKSTTQMQSLVANGMNIVIHEPEQVLPDLRSNAVKLFATVQSHCDAHEQAVQLGGQSLEGKWENPVFSVSNIADCDANVVQLRVFR